MSRMLANGPGDRGSIPGRIIPKTQKMVFDTALLSTQHYKIRIKGKVEQSRKWSSALPDTFGSLSTKVANFTLDLWIHWIPIVTVVHDDIDASIQKEVKDSNILLLYWEFGWSKEKIMFILNIEPTKLSFSYNLNWKFLYSAILNVFSVLL